MINSKKTLVYNALNLFSGQVLEDIKKPREQTIATKKVRPIIKWTGGKFEEFPMFSQYIPPFKNYYEPFFGGGGVFFALQPKGLSFLNDKSNDLARFYSQLQSPDLKTQLSQYAKAWESAGRFSHEIILLLSAHFNDFVRDKLSLDEMKQLISSAVVQLTQKDFEPLFNDDFIINKHQFILKLKASLADKFKRIKAICAKENRIFNTNELEEHIETGVRSGLYLYLRTIMNKHALGTIELNRAKATANWYFVREFCYASMFRYNRNKEFNIPYGGIAYNSKNFRLKTENIFQPAIRHLFKKSTFYNLDFADFLNQAKPTVEDFIFLDPPYDSEFSEYDQNAFTKDDQVRLRDTLLKTKGKWMMVIKETAFIRSLYTMPGIYFIEFDKTYTYNVRGRNNRDTKHLIIVNYLT